MNTTLDLAQIAQHSQHASDSLVDMGADCRSNALQRLAQLLDKYQYDILDANTLDLEASREMAVPGTMLDWLRLTPERLQSVSQMLEALAARPDPLDHILPSSYRSVHTAQSYEQRVPLGVIGLIYESFPELGAIAAGLCLKSGNGLILKGGGEASHSNRVITEVIQEAVTQADGDRHCVQLLPPNHTDVMRELLTLNSHLNLIIPYGRSTLIHRVIQHATVPTLKTAIGHNCLYCSDDGSLKMAIAMILDSHTGSPDAVNAIEHVLIHRRCSPDGVARLVQQLHAQERWAVSVTPALAAQLSAPEVSVVTRAEDWGQDSFAPNILIQQVQDVSAAVQWMNRYSQGHSSCIATSFYQESRYFTRHITSTVVHVNVSPKFDRQPKGGSIALGIARNDGQSGGYITTRRLTSQKHIFQG